MEKIFMLLSLLVLSACASYPVPRYAVSTENVMKAKKLKNRKVDLVFSSSAKEGGNPLKNEIKCRLAGPISITDGSTFPAYVEKALKDELIFAEAYKKGAKRKLKVHVSKIDIGTAPAYWHIKGKVTAGSQSKEISHKRSFESSFIAENACRESANNFSSAVAEFNGKVIDFLISR